MPTLDAIEKTLDRELLLLDDLPAGANDEARDAFNHGLYAGLLRDALLTNKSGISVALFARWGQGKSTVVNLLKRQIVERACVVIFNAYHARGDSVRRQMLLKILHEIGSSKAAEFERFTQVNVPLEFAKAEVKDRYEGLGLIRMVMFRGKCDPLLVACAVLGLSTLALYVYELAKIFLGQKSFADGKDLLAFIGIFVVAGLGYVWRKFDERKHEILAYTQPVSDSQKLKYPEQFQRVFECEVDEFTKRNRKRLIIVVDDLDRCDPATVVEALACVRQFCHMRTPGQIDCQFLIPCDEEQMVAALEADGYLLTQNKTRYHNYSETEMLRKFFDVVVRMDEIVPESLATYASELAGLIGTNAALAREMVDAARIKEPRKVKTLVNALKLAKEAIVRSRAEDRFPADDELDHVDNTLAAVVCLQELAPRAFALVRENPDCLDYDNLKRVAETRNIELESVTASVLSGLAPLSIVTAEVLITKQNEPSLRGKIWAHAFPSAVRRGDANEVLRILAESDARDHAILLNWLGQKAKEAQSVAKLRQLVNFVLDHGSRTNWTNSDFKVFFVVLPKRSHLLGGVLNASDRYDAWVSYCSTLQPRERRAYDRLVAANFCENPDTHVGEMRYLLHFSNDLDLPEARAFGNWLSETVGEKKRELNYERLKRLESYLPQDETRFFGFAPDLGVWLVNRFEPNQVTDRALQKTIAVLSLRLIGSDTSAGQRALECLCEGKSFLHNPQPISDPFLNSFGRAVLDVIRGLLVQVPDLPRFRDLYRSRVLSWFNAQNAMPGRRTLLETIGPGLWRLEKEDLENLAAIFVPWVVQDATFGNDVFTASGDPPERGQFRQKWEAFSTTLFDKVADNVRDAAALSKGAKAFFANAKKSMWTVQNKAEELLTEKARRLAPNAGTRPNNIDEWIEALQPLCGPTPSGLAEVISKNLGQKDAIRDTVRVALTTIWSEAIPETHASPLVEAMQIGGSSVWGDRNFSNTVFTKPGFEVAADFFIVRLQKMNVDWLQQNATMLEVLSARVAKTGLAQKFQDSIRELLIANRRELVEIGVRLLNPQNRLSQDVRKSLEVWEKSNSARNDDLLKAVQELLKLPS